MRSAHIPAALISVIVLLTFGADLYIVLIAQVPTSNEHLADIMLGALAVMATNCVSYWTGAAASGVRKDEMIAKQSEMLAQAPPPNPNP